MNNQDKEWVQSLIRNEGLFYVATKFLSDSELDSLGIGEECKAVREAFQALENKLRLLGVNLDE